MATAVIMPKFGMAQEDGTVLRWLKAEGDAVEKGDVILEVMTDKMDMEVEAQTGGVLAGIRIAADVTVPVATVLAYILKPGETLPDEERTDDIAPPPSASPSAPKVSPVAQRVADEAGVDLAAVRGSGPGGRITRVDVEARAQSVQLESTIAEKVRATPAARRLVREVGGNLADIAGTGPKGRVQADDVNRDAALLAAQRITGQPLRGMRKTIADRLSKSWQTIPHVTFTASIDMTAAEALRQQLGPEIEAQTGVALTPTPLIAQAVATALTRHPRLNAWLQPQGNDLLLNECAAVNLGIAIALDDGLIVPVIRGAEGMGLLELTTAIAELSRRARAGELIPDDVAEGTFTISNLGMYPLDHFTAIINPPQVAILAVARAQVKPVWDGVAFASRPVMQVTLSADHRAVDGAVAAAFLAELKQLLEVPARMLM